MAPMERDLPAAVHGVVVRRRLNVSLALIIWADVSG
jgi:hypothetical protein